jgi:predicted nucleotidyltransferase component of viral defense system
MKYNLNGVKVEFFTPPFNLLEEKIWMDDLSIFYENSKLKMASLETIIYMKTMAFWNRKKYRDLYDIYFVISNDIYSTKVFLDIYKKCNITYTTKMLFEKIKSKEDFHEKSNDEGIPTLVVNPKSYEWYRKKIEDYIYDVYIEELYS